MKPMISDIKTRTNVILTNFKFLSLDSRIRIFNTNCISYYGSNLSNQQSTTIRDLDRAWRVCSRRLLGVSERTHCNLIPSLMSTLSPSLEVLNRMLNFFTFGYGHPSEAVSFYFKNCLANRESIMYRNLSAMSQVLNLNLNHLMVAMKREVKRKLYNLDESQEKWRLEFIKEVIDCKEHFLHCSFDNAQLKTILDSLCVD